MSTTQKNVLESHGILVNKNTIEEFKNCNKSDILNDAGKTLWENIINGNAIKDPSLLSTFVLLSFAVSLFQSLRVTRQQQSLTRHFYFNILRISRNTTITIFLVFLFRPHQSLQRLRTQTIFL